jgi:hypothetical protein
MSLKPTRETKLSKPTDLKPPALEGTQNRKRRAVVFLAAGKR